LEDLDRDRITRHFGVSVEQIYQATEGLLGVSCEAGKIHLNEPYILVEKEWQDAERTRFIPVITDLWRRSQPVIRYRLNDVLEVSGPVCPCGRVSLPLARIVGRSDDVLWLEGASGRVPVFPDVLARVIMGAFPNLEDYRVEEVSEQVWKIGLQPTPDVADEVKIRDACENLARRLGAAPPRLETTDLISRPSGKQRRIRGLSRPCAR
jgi:putative adenylate-forming enzyme